MPTMRFAILPILGTKTDVPANDASLFKPITENVFATHDVGGSNFDVSRKRNACSKALGRTRWSKTANAQATKCLGLFELYDGTNRDHLFWDNGKLFVFDAVKAQTDITTAATTYQKADADLVSMIKLGSDVVFTDNIDGVTIQAWANGDANAAAAITGGFTQFKFRYLEYFARRVVGAYSDQTNGDIDIRWSNALPTAQTDLEFESAAAAKDYQLWVPNDDSLTGVRKMGKNACMFYCEDSINQMIYYPNYTTPFEIYTAVQGQGFAGHHGIVSLGDRHFGFNKNYGFCEYRGGSEIIPISDNIESYLSAINPSYYNLIVGTKATFNDSIMWTDPTGGDIYTYNYRSSEWTIGSADARYLDVWNMYGDAYVWNTLVTDLTNAGYGASPTWNDLLDWMGPKVKWSDLTSPSTEAVMGYDDGHLYQFIGGSDPIEASHNAYRIEPIMDFGNPTKKKLLNEIWFDIGISGNFSIKVWHRFGDTVGEVEGQGWTELDTVSCNSPEVPAVRGMSPSAGAKFHQIRWGNESNGAQFEVNRITLIVEPQGY